MDRFKAANRASIFGIIGNIILIIIKGIVGFSTNSQAMISDTFNSAGDIFSSVMTFIGNKIASKSADDDHNLGHGKAEYIYSLLISISMMVVSLRLCYSSILSIFLKYEYHFSWYLIVVCIVTIIIKMFLYIYTHKIAKKYDNLLIDANAKDHRNDCILTTMTLLASVAGFYKITVIDGIVGAIVSSWIFYVGIKIYKESYDVLMDKGMNEDTRNKVYEIIKNYPDIKGINHFNSTPVGYQYQISITIFVDGNLSTYESHNIANSLEKEIAKLDEIYLAIIHVNPI